MVRMAALVQQASWEEKQSPQDGEEPVDGAERWLSRTPLALIDRRASMMSAVSDGTDLPSDLDEIEAETSDAWASDDSAQS